MTHVVQPLGGPLLTRGYRVLLGMAGIALLLIAWRFAAGLGAVTGLNDGYPWGIWIAFDVVTGTALACGGYAMALLVYALSRGEYHPLVRPALLTSALGYSIAGVAIAVDVGRPWFIHRIPLRPDLWNLNSALLEVALCVMAYVIVLWIELAPVFLRRWAAGGETGFTRFARAATRGLNRAMPFIIALGILLPTMHQSSLGTVMVLAGPKLHPLWQTTFLPGLFLVSCIGMGFAMVVVESSLAVLAFDRRPETPMLGRLSRAASITVALFLVFRFGDLAVRGQFGALFGAGRYSLLFWLETILFVLPALMFLRATVRRHLGALFGWSCILALAGALYRFDTYLLAFDPGPGWSYFPAAPEILITLGFVAIEVALYVAIVKRFPILGGPPAGSGRVEVTA
ncbi:MAG: Ni/Fe-hydrogenase cytochrome b subunit [Acidobacteriota bacterium]